MPHTPALFVRKRKSSYRATAFNVFIQRSTHRTVLKLLETESDHTFAKACYADLGEYSTRRFRSGNTSRRGMSINPENSLSGFFTSRRSHHGEKHTFINIELTSAKRPPPPEYLYLFYIFFSPPRLFPPGIRKIIFFCLNHNFIQFN
jgi:hypothetical protein